MAHRRHGLVAADAHDGHVAAVLLRQLHGPLHGELAVRVDDERLPLRERPPFGVDAHLRFGVDGLLDADCDVHSRCPPRFRVRRPATPHSS